MQTLYGSLFGLFGMAQLHTVVLLGMLVVALFKPERVADWSSFRRAVIAFVLAVALPGVAALSSGDLGRASTPDTWMLQGVVAAESVLTALTVYWLVASLLPAGGSKETT